MGTRAAATRDGLYRRGRIWWVRTDPITRRPVSTRCTDLEAARRWRRERERVAADPANAAAATAELGAWIGELLRVKREQGRSAATLAIAAQKLGHAARIFGVRASLSSFVPETVDAYVAQRRAEGASNHTISKEFDLIAAMLRLAKRGGCYPGDVDALRPPDLQPGYRPRTRSLTWAELAALLGELTPRRAAFVCLVVALGPRRSEAFRIGPQSAESTAVLIPGTKTKGAYRVVPVLSPFRELYERALPHLPLEPWRELGRDLHRACKRAGIAPCTPNDLRRTHATLLVEGGVDRDVVRRLLGHTTTAMVDRVYGQPRVTALAALAEGALAASTQQVRDSGVDASSVSAEPPSRFELETYGLRNRTQGGQEGGESAKTAEKASADDPEGPPVAGADATSTLHPKHPAYPPAVWALALAAGRVLSRRTFLVEGTIRKGARRAG